MPRTARQHTILYPNGCESDLLYKSETVWDVISDFARTHTFQQIIDLFGNVRDSDATGIGYYLDCIMLEEEVPAKWERRYSMNNVIVSTDGMRFVVNTNWGEPRKGDRDCWQAFKDAAKKAGYIVK